MELVETPDHHEMPRKIMMPRGFLATFLSEHSHTKWWYYHSRHMTAGFPGCIRNGRLVITALVIYIVFFYSLTKTATDIEIPILVIKPGDFDLLSTKL